MKSEEFQNKMIESGMEQTDQGSALSHRVTEVQTLCAEELAIDCNDADFWDMSMRQVQQTVNQSRRLRNALKEVTQVLKSVQRHLQNPVEKN